jgi:hypothetical protein
MDALRIERVGLSQASPTRACLGSGSKREPTAVADKPGKTGQPDKSAGVKVTADETALRITYDKEIERIVAQVFDKESATVVKQLPSEELVAFLRKFRKAVALLVDKTV